MGRLEGKVAIVTGGAGGIGQKTSETFLKEGAKVVLVDMNEELLNTAKSNLQHLGEVIAIKADVTSEDDVKNYVNETVEKFGHINIFFNNAGIEGKVAPIVDQEIEVVDKVLKVNVHGVFLGLKHVLPVMSRQKSGSIINTSSDAGLSGDPGIAPYAASKHAVVGFTKTAALEVASNNVRVNSIHPTSVNTRMMRSIESGVNPEDDSKAKEDLTNEIPLGRYGETHEISNLVLFLASDESSFISGSQYRIDGGIGAKH
ncbi:NAD(P)-dependent dehydrogenase, short-chain alcohol dehydrogenase family [Lentibacillus persicus]|uniref:NAD(P)-dependent dehydrogenase, short-chain alcohol dehydrogenase family n=1 Tax=Lentibacillus persicus TaxID=640948 RepID=A0A1I1Z1E6_9BACI|nr:glucose 1-dehydrogenase [Lentibacillus persicus]SFE24100.1 NAD(P)-dependent dehydrogenase, short-chain alcohol dehydrogenase family [Lentibacillus persicus]